MSRAFFKSDIILMKMNHMERIELGKMGGGAETERHERADAAANRALILQTAERLFRERGVENVCMAEIAEAAGVGKGTLYRRFANKGELCLALMDTQMSEFQNAMLTLFNGLSAQGVSFLEQLATFLRSLVEFTEVHTPLLAEVQRAGMIPGNVPLNMPHFWQYMTVSALLRSALGEPAAEISRCVADFDFVRALALLRAAMLNLPGPAPTTKPGGFDG